MKTILITAALVASSAALAQNTTMQTQTEPEMEAQKQMPDGQAQPEQMPTPPGDGITQEGTNPEGDAIAPPGANIVATPPPGAGVVVAPNQDAVFQPHPPRVDYPRCTREVTDNCVQGRPPR